MNDSDDTLIQTLGVRERHREHYGEKWDPIYADRLLWRAQTFRHIVHLVPGQSILELGCGQAAFTRRLNAVTRGENPITAATFHPSASHPDELPENVEFIALSSLPGKLEGRTFDFIVALDMLDRRACRQVLALAYELLKPGGQFLFYESNPWNIVLRVRRAISKLLGRGDPRLLITRSQLREMTSHAGFINCLTVYNDFVYWPLSRHTIWLLRNLSIILENMPVVRTLAGAILLSAQKPPEALQTPKISLCRHKQFFGAVSVVVPCRNEEMNVRPLVSGLRALYGEYLREIVLVDDNSDDSTAEVIRALAKEDQTVKPVFRSPPNGVGLALADGYRTATGAWILSMDCDFQRLLPEVRDMFDAAADGCDVVVGSRFSRHSVLLNYPVAKIIANRGFHVLAQILLLRKFRDLTNNLKLMRREVIARLMLTQPGFAANAETGFQPLLMGYRVCEAPISWINRTSKMGASSFRLFRMGGGYIQVLFGLWLRAAFHTGPYKRLGTSQPEKNS